MLYSEIPGYIMDNMTVVHQFAAKLGLLAETSIIEKAKELLRLLELKGSSLTQIGNYARCVICLDLSTSLYGHEFDTQTAQKLSGFKKPSYLNNRRIVEKLLELSKPVGVPEICIQLGLTEVQEASTLALNQFVENNKLRNIDTAHPQYAAMAVYQLCKIKKIRIQKNKLISISHLKPSQWTVLEKSWETWAKKNQGPGQELVAPSTKDERSNKNDIPLENGCVKDPKPKNDSDSTEEFHEWRERVLAKAFVDLENQRNV